jgi:hypothetical protein
MVADGSYMAKQSTELGSTAWIVEDLQTGDSCKGMVRTSATENEVNAYRSKLQGLHAAVASLLRVICQHHKVQSGKVTLCCNNENALWLSSICSTQVPLRTKHTDLIRAICKIVLELPIEVVFKDVMGHQDKHVLYKDLDRPSQLNVQVDSEAKRYLRYLLQMDEDGNLDYASDSILQGWSCWLDQTKVTSDPLNEIIKYVYHRKMKEHCATKEGLSPEAFDTIDWDAIEDSTDSSLELFNLWMTKQISGFCPCDKNMK